MELGSLVLEIVGGFVVVGILVGSINSLWFGERMGYTAGQMIVSGIIGWPAWLLLGAIILVLRLAGYRVTPQRSCLIVTTQSGEEMMRLPLESNMEIDERS